MASLDIDHIVKRFGTEIVLYDISISISDGEFLVLVGPSGCGKSTLMNIIAGLEEPSQGAVRLDGQDITHTGPADRNISMVFQSYALYPNMTVAQNIAFPLEMHKVPKSQRQARVEEVAKLLQIEHLLARKPRQLSGGQRQRVAIGRALARQPKLYLFDEPLSNLDAQLRLDMRTEIKKLHQRLKASIVYVTHDQIEAMTLASRIAVMKSGVLQQLGTPSEVYNQPANVFVATFIGSPRMNLLKSSVEGSGDALAFRLGEGEQALSIPVPVRMRAGVQAHGAKALTVGIRPEAIDLCETGKTLSPTQMQTQARVVLTEPTGADTQALLSLAGMEVTALLAPDLSLRAGDNVPITLELAKLVCFDVTSQMRVA